MQTGTFIAKQFSQVRQLENWTFVEVKETGELKFFLHIACQFVFTV